MKKCRTCSGEFSLTLFAKDKRTKDGISTSCMPCIRSGYRVRTPEERERLNQYMRTYRYGVSPERYNSMLLEQGNACAVCKVSFTEARACIDHDHNCCAGTRSCGKCVRGLLCINCNAAAGYIETKFSYMEDMFAYLRTHLELRVMSQTEGGN